MCRPGIPAWSQDSTHYYFMPVTDTVKPGGAYNPTPGPYAAVALLRNVSAYNAAFPVNYSVYAGCDSVSQDILPDGSGAPRFFSFLNGGPITITNQSIALAALLEVRLVMVSSQVQPRLPHNTAALLPAFQAVITMVDAVHSQIMLSAPLETSIFVIVVKQQQYTCYLNYPGPETPYSTRGNTLRIAIDSCAGAPLAVINASPSATASGAVSLLDLCPPPQTLHKVGK